MKRENEKRGMKGEYKRKRDCLTFVSGSLFFFRYIEISVSYLAKLTARVSRMTVILTCPG